MLFVLRGRGWRMSLESRLISVQYSKIEKDSTEGNKKLLH